MKRFFALLSLIVATALSGYGGTLAQDAAPGIPPVVWVSNDFGTTIEPIGTPVEGAVAPTRAYRLQFLPQGQLSLHADCNSGFGTYQIDGSNLTFGPRGTTLMLCPEDGAGDAFLQALDDVISWSIETNDANDELVLGLVDGGVLSFSPSLIGVEWQWAGAEMSDDTVIVPNDPAAFSLSFSSDGTVAGQIDCNRAHGSYRVDGSRFDITMATTMMYCGDDSLDTVYGQDLDRVTSFVISDGQLALAMELDSGIMYFDPVIPD